MRCRHELQKRARPRKGGRWGTTCICRLRYAFYLCLPPEKPQRDRTSALLTALCGEYSVLSGYRPLSLGIRTAVHAAVPCVTSRIVNCALARHCRCDHYLKALAADGPRFGLDGVPSGEVSEEHRAAAVLILSR